MRSLLFVPGDSERKMQRGSEAGADALILDLEDSVAPGRRAAARELTRSFLQSRPPGRRCYVRVNPLPTSMALEDLAATMPGRPEGIILPKATPDDLRRLDHYLAALEAASSIAIGTTRVIVIATEHPAAMFVMGGYRGVTPRLEGVSWGAEDLSAAIGAAANRREDGVYDDVFRLARSMCILAAAAADAAPVDTVFTDFRDEAGLRAECVAARRAGFTAKMAIHPAQVAAINESFSASEAEIAWAKEVIAAFAANPEAGTIGVGGKMVDRPHLVLAQRILGRL
jgi:citrate lyase subunit beta/citryl-CoA lyase